jgi:hypothetical protein
VTQWTNLNRASFTFELYHRILRYTNKCISILADKKGQPYPSRFSWSSQIFSMWQTSGTKFCPHREINVANAETNLLTTLSKVWPILTKLSTTQNIALHISCNEFFLNQIKNVENTGISFKSSIKVQISLFWFSWNSQIQNGLAWRS